MNDVNGQIRWLRDREQDRVRDTGDESVRPVRHGRIGTAFIAAATWLDKTTMKLVIWIVLLLGGLAALAAAVVTGVALFAILWAQTGTTWLLAWVYTLVGAGVGLEKMSSVVVESKAAFWGKRLMTGLLNGLWTGLLWPALVGHAIVRATKE
jgi:hypothetical protein